MTAEISLMSLVIACIAFRIIATNDPPDNAIIALFVLACFFIGITVFAATALFTISKFIFGN